MSQSTGKMDKGKNVGSPPALTVPSVPSVPSVHSALAGTAVVLTKTYAIVLTVKCGVAGHTIATTFELLKTPDVTEYLEMPLATSNKADGLGMTHWGIAFSLLILRCLTSPQFLERYSPTY